MLNRMNKITLVFTIFIIALFSCGENNPVAVNHTLPINDGIWRGKLTLDSTGTICPFNYYLSGRFPDSLCIEIYNAEERIFVNDIQIRNDSVFIKMPIYESEFRLRFDSTSMMGYWYNKSRGADYKIPFSASYGDTRRYISKKSSSEDLNGLWATTFSKGTEEEWNATGKFKMFDSKVTGTFLTTTGDLRYLEGSIDGNELNLSSFDGSHAFAFKGEISGDTIKKGIFASGIHHSETWSASRINDYKEEITPVSEMVYDTARFTFTLFNESGDSITEIDPRVSGKMKIIQIMGSWCPNCLDEARYFSDIYNTYSSNGLVILGVSFERTETIDEAWRKINDFRKNVGCSYPYFYGGRPGKKQILDLFPAMKDFKAYPTSIFLNKDNEVIKVHTGFSGPATGIYYDEYKQEIVQLIKNELNIPETIE